MPQVWFTCERRIILHWNNGHQGILRYGDERYAMVNTVADHQGRDGVATVWFANSFERKINCNMVNGNVRALSPTR